MNKKTKRRFIFIDESGDPGFPGLSDTYQLNILVVDDDKVPDIEREISLYKYFLDHHGELKNKTNIKNQQIKNLLIKVNCLKGVNFFHTRIVKDSYTGSHKNKPTFFRNMLIKRMLQALRKQNILSDDIGIEIVIDRYISSFDQELDLKKYLNDGYNLPKFLHIEQVDSRYCQLIQILDVLGTFSVKEDIQVGSFIDLDMCLKKEKGPDAS